MQTKMASFKPEVPISQVEHNMGTNFQRLYPCFVGRAIRGDKWQYCPMSIFFVENRRWPPLTGSKNDITYISACLHDSNKIPRLYPCFSRRLDYCGDCLTCGFVRNGRWRSATGSRNNITHSSAFIRDSNEIQLLYPCFRDRVTRQ